VTESTKRVGEPEILKLGNAFELIFRTQFPGPDGTGEGVGVVSQCNVVRSRGTERSSMLDSQGSVTYDPELAVSLRIVRPIVLRGFGRVDLMIFYIDDDALECHVCVEVKNTHWDKNQRNRLTKSLGTHRRQLYGYLEPLEYRARRGKIGRPQGILVYPERPKHFDADSIIQLYMAEYGIQVEFADEILDKDAEATPLRESDLGRQPWLTEAPACAICSSGEVVIAQKPPPAWPSEDLRLMHARVCPGSE
jgi:hypothetical protein